MRSPWVTSLLTTISATAITAAGFLTLAAPAQAAGCSQWGFNGTLQLRGQPKSTGDSAWQVVITAAGRFADWSGAVVYFDDGQKVYGHVVTGEIAGHDVSFRIKYDDKPDNFWDFNGTVGDDGYAHGTESLPGGDFPATWSSQQALRCLDETQGVPKQDDPAPVPAPAPAPPVAPKDAITVTFTRAGLQEKVAVTNTADLAGTCTYVASPVGNPVLPTVNRAFAISAKGNQQLTVLAPPPLSTYHVVVSCLGSFTGQTVEFGHVEKNLSG